MITLPDFLTQSKPRSNKFRDKTPLHLGMKLVVYTDGIFRQPIDARFYWAPKSNVCYCIVWIRHQNYCGHGIGKAGGYGYHHESQALWDALTHMGITFSRDYVLPGAGENAMERCLMDIGDKLFGDVPMTIVKFDR